MNRTSRKVAGMVVGVAVAAMAGSASAQNNTGNAAIDASLRGAVERKDVPGVVALVTDRDRVLYQGAFGVADVSTSRPLTQGALLGSHRALDPDRTWYLPDGTVLKPHHISTKAAVKFGLLLRRNRQRVLICGNAVPNVFDELDPLVQRKIL